MQNKKSTTTNLSTTTKNEKNWYADMYAVDQMQLSTKRKKKP